MINVGPVALTFIRGGKLLKRSTQKALSLENNWRWNMSVAKSPGSKVRAVSPTRERARVFLLSNDLWRPRGNSLHRPALTFLQLAVQINGKVIYPGDRRVCLLWGGCACDGHTRQISTGGHTVEGAPNQSARQPFDVSNTPCNYALFAVVRIRTLASAADARAIVWRMTRPTGAV